VSIKFAGRIRTVAADRAAYAIANGCYPNGRVVHLDGNPENMASGNLVDGPRRARSTGRRGGLVAEKARDLAALAAVEAGAETADAVARTMNAYCGNARRRLVKLAAKGLLEAVCVPPRSHWLLTATGRAAIASEATNAEEADLLQPHDLNGHHVPWLDWSKMSATGDRRHAEDDEADSEDAPAPVRTRKGLTSHQVRNDEGVMVAING
jgi:hypothetical protein